MARDLTVGECPAGRVVRLDSDEARKLGVFLIEMAYAIEHDAERRR